MPLLCNTNTPLLLKPYTRPYLIIKYYSNSNNRRLVTLKLNTFLSISIISIIVSRCLHSHTHTHGGAAQLEVGSLPVSVSWPSALHCYLCLTHCSPGNVPNPTPSTPLVNTGQPTIYHLSVDGMYRPATYRGCRGVGFPRHQGECL